MAADPETAAGFRRIETGLAEIREDVKNARDDSSKRSAELHKRIDTLVEGLGRVDKNEATTREKLKGHILQDDTRFKSVGDDLKDGKQDRRGMWKAIAGGSVGGAFLSKIVASLTGGTQG